MTDKEFEEIWKPVANVIEYCRLEYDEAVTIGGQFGKLKSEIQRLQEILSDLNNELFHERTENDRKNREIERLERINKESREMIADQFNNMQRYIQGLKFYADEEHYEPLHVEFSKQTNEGYKISKYSVPPKIETDKGKKARQALNK